jgi:hypothetical protein
MAEFFPRYYISRPIREMDYEHLRQARDCLNEARAALALPVPSTFLGKSVHDTSHVEQNPHAKT